MIWAAVVVGKDGDFVITQVRVHYERNLSVIVKFIMLQGKTVGLFAGLLVLHGILVRPWTNLSENKNSGLFRAEFGHDKIFSDVYERIRLR